MSPILVGFSDASAEAVHAVEAFGPVASVVTYSTVRSSPAVPGWRPSNRSDARTLMPRRRPSPVIARSVGGAIDIVVNMYTPDVVAAGKIPTDERLPPFERTIQNAKRTDELFDGSGREPRQDRQVAAIALQRVLGQAAGDAKVVEIRGDVVGHLTLPEAEE